MLKFITLLSTLAGVYILANAAPITGTCGINGVEEDSINPNIFGGTDVKDPSRWPWMVSLRSTEYEMHSCGGTILNSNWILTAAHCVSTWSGTLETSLLEIYLGSTNLEVDEPSRQVVGVKSIKAHSGFNWDISEGNDLALVEVDQPLVFNDYVKPVCLPDGSDVPFTDCFIIGWGHQGNDEDTGELSGAGTTLREAAAWVNSDEECLAIWREWDPFVPEEYLNKTLEGKNQLCMDGMDESASCKGDSGGPLLCLQGGENWVVAGVTSWGPVPFQCGGKPFFYTNVTYYLDWIEQECRECFL